MMRSHVFIVLSEVSVLIRWQQIAPKFSIFSEVERKAQRIAETFKDAIKDVVHGEWFNSSHIQIMELVFWKLTLFNSLTERSAIWLESICSWEDNNNICTQEIIKVREWIPHIGPLTRVIRLKLFLDIVLSSFADITRALRGCFRGGSVCFVSFNKNLQLWRCLLWFLITSKGASTPASICCNTFRNLNGR